ncbi:MAG: SusD/RagB family nutrient-binding outer membrane lipoprotein [Flavobacteriaceae bacterium]|nr:SusD/RagB family nutrient-binding outer membrane lipoprotein [Flavobacteriaceae bacterium]
MKKIILFTITASMLIITSCVNDSEDFNKERKKPYSAPAVGFVNFAEVNLATQMATPLRSSNVCRYFQHYYAATTYYEESRFNFTGGGMPETHWTELYRDVLGNLVSAIKAVNDESKPITIVQADWDILKKNKLAVIDLLQVYTFHVLVDTYGNVPYFEALDPDWPLPKYDDAATIYEDLLRRVDEDLAMLDISQPEVFAEHLLGGNVAGWIRFANSLKLKLGINLVDVNPALAQKAIEEAYNGGVVLDGSDNIIFRFVVEVHNNPVYSSLVGNGRNDYVVEETIVNKLYDLNDPRQDIYFKDKVGGVYVGGILGIGNDHPTCSHVGTVLIQKDTPSYLFDSAEINFYLAEAAARGFSVGDTAESYYTKAITESFKQWGIPDAEITTYLTNPAVQYSSTNWKESIGEQVWIAMFNRPFESWTSYRRLDYPSYITNTPNAIAAAQSKVPVRVTYPVTEQTVNGASWRDARDAIGGDELTVRLFWDVN